MQDRVYRSGHFDQRCTGIKQRSVVVRVYIICRFLFNCVVHFQEIAIGIVSTITRLDHRTQGATPIDHALGYEEIKYPVL